MKIVDDQLDRLELTVLVGKCTRKCMCPVAALSVIQLTALIIALTVRHK